MKNEKENRIGANKREGVWWIRGKKKKESQKEKWEENQIEEKRKKGGEKKREIFLAFRWSNLDGSRVKVDPRNEGYAWVPKYGSFVKLQKVEIFPTLIIFSLKVI